MVGEQNCHGLSVIVRVHRIESGGSGRISWLGIAHGDFVACLTSAVIGVLAELEWMLLCTNRVRVLRKVLNVLILDSAQMRYVGLNVLIVRRWMMSNGRKPVKGNRK